jgi:tetratricopeptide (TPR) repeat protein
MELTENTKCPTICLNMIVKNESKIITRLFNSVLPIIDTYCICDTGSTDNTIEIIKNYFDSKGIQGKVVQEPFKNFCHNRNFALKSCQGLSDFVLLLDADMILEVKKFDKKFLHNVDSCTLLQGNDDFFYQNLRIVRNNGKYFYNGVTHEYLNCPPQNRSCNIGKDVLFIRDIGDGGSKADKFERDARLLLEGIKEEPKNDRYHFYLANTYHDLGKLDEAIEYYRKRIELKGWDQEVWYSFYKMAFCFKRQNKISEALTTWLDAYNFMPQRLENLYEIIHHYRNIGKTKLCQVFYDLAMKSLNEKHNREHYLFLHNDVYTYKLFFEYTIFSCYNGNKNINNEVVAIFNNCKDFSMTRNLLSNMKFYKFVLQQKSKKEFDDTDIIDINNTLTKFISSSSCLIPNGDGYLMNIRYVNYYIKPNGAYINCDNHIITHNKVVYLTKELQKITENFIEEPFVNRRYIGVEDLKIFNTTDGIKYIGTGYHQNHRIGIVFGNYLKENTLNPIEIKSSFNDEECEKNWVFYDTNKIIYKWYPMQICEIKDDNKLYVKEVKQMPAYFSNVRGSSCGFTYKEEIWFVGHVVSYESPRHYYHVISVFDKNMNLLRYSAPFKFEEECIEYCLSIVVEDERVLINYSGMDRTTRIGVYEKKYIDSILEYKP